MVCEGGKRECEEEGGNKRECEEEGESRFIKEENLALSRIKKLISINKVTTKPSPSP
jgi:hypothetical protein